MRGALYWRGEVKGRVAPTGRRMFYGAGFPIMLKKGGGAGRKGEWAVGRWFVSCLTEAAFGVPLGVWAAENQSAPLQSAGATVARTGALGNEVSARVRLAGAAPEPGLAVHSDPEAAARKRLSKEQDFEVFIVGLMLNA